VNAALRSARAELSKIFTTRAWWVLAVILAGYVALLSGGLVIVVFGVAGTDAAQGGMFAPLAYSMTTAVGYVMPLLLGALVVTTEHRHGTLTPTFLATPSRGAVLAGKFGAGLVVAALLGVIGLAAAVAAGAIPLAAFGADTLLGDGDTWLMFGRILLAMALWGAIGVAFGVLLPSQVGAIIVVLAFTQFVEPVLRTAGAFVEGLDQVVRFLPGAASDSLVGTSVFTAFTAQGAEALPWWAAALVLAGYAAVFAAIGAATTWRRDVT
jgi:ABC-2 type transport system permease protein